MTDLAPAQPFAVPGPPQPTLAGLDLGRRAADAPPLSLSVVIPVLDAAAFLPQQLAALAEQSWAGDWEVIVADNGSRDGSVEVARAAAARLPRLTVVDASDRRGQAHARNVGAAAARGEALLFIDADDVAAPGWLAALGRALAEHPFVASRFDTARLNEPWVEEARGNPQAMGLNPYVYPPYLPHAGGCGLGIRRALHERIGGFDETLAALEDTDYCWRLQRLGVALRFVPDAVVHVRYRGDLRGIFRQGLFYGEHNVRIYARYRKLDMPRLPWTAGAMRLAKLAATLPLAVTRVRRAQWVWQAGWRLGRLRGCWRYRVLAP
ncbi:MAG TPA: glycosyltransferase family A protein [Thermoanaerobaculia bacterium]